MSHIAPISENKDKMEKIVNELLKKKFVTEDDIVKAISRNFAIKKFDLLKKNVVIQI